MLNNKYSKKVQDLLKDLTYEDKVKMYDNKCVDCPFKALYTEIQGIKKYHNTITEAISELLETTSKNSKIVRGCGFNDDFYSLNEIVFNGCTFWFPERCEKNDNELEIVEDIDVASLRKSDIS